LMVRLAKGDLETGGRSLGGQALLNGGKRIRAIDLRLALAQQIEIGSVENEDWFHRLKCSAELKKMAATAVLRPLLAAFFLECKKPMTFSRLLHRQRVCSRRLRTPCIRFCAF